MELVIAFIVGAILIWGIQYTCYKLFGNHYYRASVILLSLVIAILLLTLVYTK